MLLLTAFGSDGPRLATETGPAPAQRLLPSGPPQPQVVATQDSLRLQLPINQRRVTAIGYHAAGTAALALEPVGSQANAGLFGRLFQRLVGSDDSSIRYYLIEGGVGPRTGGLDVGAPVKTDVYAPVDGTVIAISDRIVDGRPYGKRIEIQPAGNPSAIVALSNLEIDPALTRGSTLVASATKLGRVIDLSSVERAGARPLHAGRRPARARRAPRGRVHRHPVVSASGEDPLPRRRLRRARPQGRGVAPAPISATSSRSTSASSTARTPPTGSASPPSSRRSCSRPAPTSSPPATTSGASATSSPTWGRPTACSGPRTSAERTHRAAA